MTRIRVARLESVERRSDLPARALFEQRVAELEAARVAHHANPESLRIRYRECPYTPHAGRVETEVTVTYQEDQ